MFNKYQRVWLESHPSRTKEWLKARLAEGFDVHHVNGDHSDNSPENLALMEHDDHMRLHGLSMNRLLGMAKKRKRQPIAMLHKEAMRLSKLSGKTVFEEYEALVAASNAA